MIAYCCMILKRSTSLALNRFEMLANIMIAKLVTKHCLLRSLVLINLNHNVVQHFRSLCDHHFASMT